MVSPINDEIFLLLLFVRHFYREHQCASETSSLRMLFFSPVYCQGSVTMIEWSVRTNEKELTFNMTFYGYHQKNVNPVLLLSLVSVC